jgi:hypothetical protein
MRFAEGFFDLSSLFPNKSRTCNGAPCTKDGKTDPAKAPVNRLVLSEDACPLRTQPSLEASKFASHVVLFGVPQKEDAQWYACLT